MEQLFNLEDLKNKTIKDVKILDGYSRLGIVFKDESYCIFNSYWDGTFENIELSELDGDLHYMYELGLISEEEWAQALEAEQDEYEEQAKEDRYKVNLNIL